jgi:hypothetical protein
MRSSSVEVFHVVTAAEVAAGDLLGHCTEGGQEWVPPPFPVHSGLWPIQLKSAYIEVSRGAVHVHGIHLQIYYMIGNATPGALFSGYQGWTSRASWYGDLPMKYGFGFLFRAGALAADDVIMGGAIYEHV